MFSVLFEVHPSADQRDRYLAYAKLLRPELEKIVGFVDNIRYRSLSREGWILSLSNWRDEKALVRWRTNSPHVVNGYTMYRRRVGRRCSSIITSEWAS